jgi:hypothetical protein
MEPTREELVVRIAKLEAALARKKSKRHLDHCKMLGRTPGCEGCKRIMERRKRKTAARQARERNSRPRKWKKPSTSTYEEPISVRTCQGGLPSLGKGTR